MKTKHLKNVMLLVVIAGIYACTSPNKETQSKASTASIHKKSDRLKDSLAFKLCEIYGLDQGVRRSPGMENKWDFIHPIDSMNFFKVLDFIKANGYPTQELLGEDNYASECVQSSAFAVFLHTPHILVNNKEYVDILLNEVEEGRLNRQALALFLDKYYWVRRDENDNRKVLYGTQFGKPCLKYKKQSDSVRAEIGLAPLHKDAFRRCAS